MEQINLHDNFNDISSVAIIATGTSINPSIINFVKNNFKNIICVSNSIDLFSDDLSNVIALVSSDAKWWYEYNNKESIEKYKLNDIELFCLTEPTNLSREIYKRIEFLDVQNQTNSGCFAIKVARRYFKFKNCYLFGFDGGVNHYFGLHKNISNSDNKRWKLFNEQFRKEKIDCDNEGVKVYNVNLNSRLSFFKKISNKEVI